MDKASALEDTIQYGGRQIFVVQHLPPLAKRLIGGEDHRSFSQMPIVYHMKQNIGGIRTVGQVTHFVHDQNVRPGVGEQGFLQASLLTSIGKVFHEFRGRRAKGLEAVLDGAIADGYGQMGFPAAGLAVENQGAPFGDEIRSQVGTEQGLTQGRP